MRPLFKKKKSNLKKIILSCLILSVVLMGGGLFYLVNYFDSNRLQTLIVPRLEEALQREVELSEIGLSFWPRIGVSINQFRVLNSGDFEKDYLLQLEELNLGVALRPLLNRELVIEEIILNRPSIYLEDNLAGASNYHFEVEEEELGEEESGFSFNLDNLSIIEGEIEYLNRATEINIKVSGIESRVAMALAEQQLDLKVEKLAFESLNMAQGVDSFQLADFSSNFIINSAEERIELVSLGVNLGASELSLSGDYLDSKLNFELDSRLVLRDFNNTFLAEEELDLEGELALEVAIQDLDLAEPDLTQLVVAASLGLADLKVAGNAVPTPVENMQGQLILNEDYISLRGLRADLLAGELSSRIEIEDWQAMFKALLAEADTLPGRIDLVLGSKGLDLEQLVALIELEEEAEALELPDFNLNALVELEDSYYQEWAVENVLAELYTEQGELILERATLEQGPSSLALAARVNYSDYLATQDLAELLLELSGQGDLELAQIREKLVAFNSELEEYYLSGQLLSEWELSFRGGDWLESPLQNLEQVNLGGSLTLNSRDIKAPQLNSDLKEVRAQLSFDNQKLALKDLVILLGESDLRSELQIKDWKDLSLLLAENEEAINSQFKVALNSELIVLEELSSLLVESEELAKEGEEEELELLELIKRLSFTGDAQIQELRGEELVLEELGAKLELSEGLIEASNLGFKAFGGRALGQSSLDLNQEELSYQGELIFSEIETNELLTLATNFEDRLFGKMELEVEFSGQGLAEELKQNLNFAGRAAIKEGKLADQEIVPKLNNWFNIFAEDTLSFRDLEGRVSLEEGKLHLDDFNSESSRGEINLNGYSTLEGELNYQLNYLLSDSASERINLPQKEFFYAPDTERVQLDFKLGGSVLAPEFAWDSSRAEERIREEAARKREEAEERAREKAEEKVEEEIDNIRDRIRDRF